ncbi:DMT family transporter [Sulfurimonas sp.]|uniref:DMT family transporter n=1 Tax=Sulfurimonas sp. TaxID=2022749 RepID=UPI002B472176|nr:DMT family transporter [Sulfurimonas sp.]
MYKYKIKKSIEGSFLAIGFVLLYGSGFVFTQFGLENASPMAFLALRFFIAFIILLTIAYYLKSSWPKTIKEFLHICIAGSLTVGTFSIGVFLSISYGVSASLNALVIALQPIVVTYFAMKFLGENVSKYVVIGLITGFTGVCLVIISSMSFSMTEIFGILFSFVALFGLSFGNLYQKKYCVNMNLFSGGAIQTLSSTILVIPFLFFEDIHMNFNSDFIIALSYMSVGVSIGALSLLYIMIEKGAVSKVSSIFYLMPVSAVFISWLLFDKNVDIMVIAGVVIIFISILLIMKIDKK